MVATARWMYRSALAREESRGMARREDFPRLDSGGRYHMHSGGLDDVWTQRSAIVETQIPEAAEW
jgi:succinate dehydrogenase/fumarate reductase flavoprotein subunit